MDPTHWCHRHRWSIPQSDGAPSPKPKGSWRDSLTRQTQYLQVVQAYAPTERETPILEEREREDQIGTTSRGRGGDAEATIESRRPPRRNSDVLRSTVFFLGVGG
jgi:hypothetical protein